MQLRTPKFDWTWQHDKNFDQHESNVYLHAIFSDEELWPNQPKPTLAQVKYRREVLKNLKRLNRFLTEKGEPPLDRPHSPKTFNEADAHLLGTLPDSKLAKQLDLTSQTVRFARLERKIPSYQETRHAAYDPQMEEDMLQTVKRIALLLPEDTLDKACLILHKTDPVWIRQCLEQLERKAHERSNEL